MHSTPTEGVTCLEIIQMKMMMKTSKGTSINHVDGFLGIFNPPPPMWTNVEFRQTPLRNHVDFHMTPPLYIKNIGMILEFLNPKNLIVHTRVLYVV